MYLIKEHFSLNLKEMFFPIQLSSNLIVAENEKCYSMSGEFFFFFDNSMLGELKLTFGEILLPFQYNRTKQLKLKLSFTPPPIFSNQTHLYFLT
jgi:hypothetical protein